MKHKSLICVHISVHLITYDMELQVFISKKGTQVVTADNLFQVLLLPAHQFKGTVKYWLSDVYDFGDDIRQPQPLKDYSEKKLKHGSRKDYFLSLELARLITLNSSSKVKLSFARKLDKLVKKEIDRTKLFTKDQVLAVLELTKVMGLVSCQKSVEAKLQQDRFSNPTQHREWWRYRAGLLGYSAKTLQEKMSEIGQAYKGKNLRQMLLKLDKYEIIRMAVVELFVSLGNSADYARNMGDLAKVFAKELQVEIRDDRKDTLSFLPKQGNPDLIRQLRNFARQGTLAF